MKFRLEVTSAILILLAFNSIMIGYLNSKVAYDANLAEQSTKTEATTLNKVLQLTEQNNKILSNVRLVLVNQLYLISKSTNQTNYVVNKSAEENQNQFLAMINSLQNLQDFFIAQQKQQSAQLQANSLPTPPTNMSLVNSTLAQLNQTK